MRLRIVAGPHEGEERVFEFYDTLIVGRAGDAQWPLEKDPHFSRYHFRIEANPPECQLVDLVSANGTHVNGKRVREVLLKNGDRIECGATVFAVSIQAGPAVAETATLEVPPEKRVEPGAAASMLAAHFPRQMGDLELVRELGQGGMGVVYQGKDCSTGRDVAVKAIRPTAFTTAKAMQIFLREANILGQLRHPRIVEYISFGLFEGQMYLVMEYLPTLDFRKLLKTQSRPKQIRLACGIVCYVLEALQHAHEQDIVHRDIKPANMLVYKADGRLQVKLADFGLAKSYYDAGMSVISRENDIRGTLGYISPEQLIDCRCAKPPCDIYSAGACLYHLLCGELPFEVTDTASSIALILNSRPRPLRERAGDVPPELSAAVDRAMAREPGDRFSSAQHMRAALMKFTEKPK